LNDLDDYISVSIQNINRPSNQETVVALEIARVIYGGVAEDSPQWRNCLSAAKKALGNKDVWDFHQGVDVGKRAESAQAAFQRCTEFNNRCPRGTEGMIERGEQKIPTVVENNALVFPEARDGEIVMSWFRDVGWQPIDKFTAGRPEKPPTLAEEIVALAQQIKAQQRVDMAIPMFRAALIADPECWHALNELGVIATGDQDYPKAVDYYTEALAINPKSAEMLTNRSMALRALGHLDAALSDARDAIRIMPANETVSLNEAYILDDMMRIDDAIKIIEDHLFRKPSNVNARYAKAMILLSAGRLEEGWTEFDWRLRLPAQAMHYEHYNVPRTDSDTDLTGKRVMLWPEQGIGDEIMTATMIPDLVNAVGPDGSVTVFTSERLRTLFARSFTGVKILPRPSVSQAMGLRDEPFPAEMLPPELQQSEFDFQVAQGDLGRMFRKSLDSFPLYNRLVSSEAMTKMARTKLQALHPGKKLVGLCWHSRRNILIGKMKSVSLAALGPLFEVDGVAFINLQYGDCSEEIAEAKEKFGVDLEREKMTADPLGDIDYYAARVAAMDLVITVSQTTAHLAGALGVPTWIMTPEGPGRLWYWFRVGDRAPWYPSVRLFRQPASLQWQPVIEAVAAELETWAKV
jgi:tetratricopeptide (TPR) repeat protein